MREHSNYASNEFNDKLMVLIPDIEQYNQFVLDMDVEIEAHHDSSCGVCDLYRKYKQ